MTTYALIRIDDPEQARRFVEDMREYPDHDLLTPSQEHTVHAVLVDVITHSTAQPDTEPAEQNRSALDDAHAAVTSALGELDRVRNTITEALGPADRAAVAVEQARERLQVAREMLEKRLSIAPISFDIEYVTYDVHTIDKGTWREHTVLCEGIKVATVSIFDETDPLWNDAAAAGREAVQNAINAGTWRAV